MKKSLSLAALIMLACSNAAFAKVGDVFVLDGLQYTVLTEAEGNNTVSVQHSEDDYSLSGDINIPATVYNGNVTYSVTALPGNAFAFCDNITAVSIPLSVNSIDETAFLYTPGTTNYTVDDNNETFCTVDGIIYSKDQKEVYRCPEQKSGAVSLPTSVTTIKVNAFRGCSKITAVNIPDGVTLISNGAFMDCSSLTSIAIPEKTSLQLSVSQFGVCTSLSSIEVASDNASVAMIDGILCSKDGSKIVFYPCSKTGDIQIPESVTGFLSYSFAGNPLTSITIPERVTLVEGSTFKYCNNLTGIEVDENNAAYSSKDGVLFSKNGNTLYCFACGRTGEYVIPENVTTLKTSCCSGAMISSIELPETISTLPGYAFLDCKNLKKVIFKNPTPPTSAVYSNFYGTPEDMVVVVPDGSKDAYQAKMPFLSNIVEASEASASVDVIEADSDEKVDFTQPVEIYDMSGKMIGTQIKAVKAGVYVVKQGAKTAKVAVK